MKILAIHTLFNIESGIKPCLIRKVFQLKKHIPIPLMEGFVQLNILSVLHETPKPHHTI